MPVLVAEGDEGVEFTGWIPIRRDETFSENDLDCEEEPLRRLLRRDWRS